MVVLGQAKLILCLAELGAEVVAKADHISQLVQLLRSAAAGLPPAGSPI